MHNIDNDKLLTKFWNHCIFRFIVETRCDVETESATTEHQNNGHTWDPA